MNLRACFFLFIVSLCSWAYDFSSPRCAALKLTIQQSVAAGKSRQFDKLLVSEIEKEFLAIPRDTLSADDTLELITMVSVWRHQTKTLLIKNAPVSDALVENFSSLNLSLSSEDIRKLHERTSRERLVPLVQKRGEIALQQSFLLPDEKKQIGPLAPFEKKWKPVNGNGYGGARWLEEKNHGDSFSDYRFGQNNEIQYRGMNLRTGDVILLNHQHIPDGLFNSFATPRWTFTHSALVVMPKFADVAVPSVFEVFEHGIRLVPLNYYFDRSMATYLEVYRRKNISSDWQNRLNEFASERVKENWGYDFRTRLVGADGKLSGSRKCIQCTTLVDYTFKQLGDDLRFVPSEVNEGMQKTLKQVDNAFEKYLNPSDLMRSSELELVEVQDNGEAVQVIASQLIFGAPEVEDSVSHLLSTREIDFSALPPWSRVLEETTASINAKAPGSSWLLRKLGYEHPDRFPCVPAKVVGVMKTLEAIDGPAIRAMMKFEPLTEAVQTSEAFSFHDLEIRPEIKEQKHVLLYPHRQWLKVRAD